MHYLKRAYHDGADLLSCTGNSAPSWMSEALLNSDRMDVAPERMLRNAFCAYAPKELQHGAPKAATILGCHYSQDCLIVVGILQLGLLDEVLDPIEPGCTQNRFRPTTLPKQ